MLAAILDPTKTLNEIDRSVRVGQIGGFGRRAQFEISRAQAEQFAQVDLSEADIRTGIQESAGLRPLTQETFGERLDLTEQAALEAGLGGSATEAARFANRLRTRQLQQSTVGGGAAVSGQGITGAGVV
jgi:predicted ribosome quality control (RQC) complex YloA/Tae2 family protein